jgi:UMF1 family MFS transporter
MDTTPKRAGALDAAAAHTPTRSAVASWILYDLANTIFSMGVISLFFSLWVRDEVGAERADTVYGIITAISMGIIFVCSPLLGAMTDKARRRMPFLVVSTLICVVFTLLLARGGFYLTALFFVIANIAYQAGLQFYDALLPEVSTEETRGRIGGLGVGIGYLGSYIAVGFGLLITTQAAQNYLAGIRRNELVNSLLGAGDKPLLFTLVAISFLLFALPCFFFVRERGNPHPQRINFETLRISLRGTIETLRDGQNFPDLRRFLIGRVFYTDAINTVISVMALYTVNVAMATGLSKQQGEQSANLILMSAITFAVVGGFFWGWLADKLGPKRTLDLVLQMWLGVFALAACVGIFDLPLTALYVVAAAAGFALGGVWAADRPLMLRLTPPDRIGEFYGLYGMVGRFSAITGPALWALTTYITVRVFGLAPQRGQGFSVLVLMALVLIGYAILRKVSDEKR